MERVTETLLGRRLAALGAGAETSSRASIMAILQVYFFELIRPVSSETETFRDLKTANFQEKRVFLQNCESPTNWGTEAIMLPPVVSFKKILQKSYTNVIPK
jgi:hypothetical protein